MARCGGAVPQWTANGAAAVVDGSNLGRLRCASWIPFLFRDYLGVFQKRFDCLESQMSLLPWFSQHLIFQSRNACTRPPRRIPHPRQYLTQPHLLQSLSRSFVRLPRQPYSYFISELLSRTRSSLFETPSSPRAIRTIWLSGFLFLAWSSSR